MQLSKYILWPHDDSDGDNDNSNSDIYNDDDNVNNINQRKKTLYNTQEKSKQQERKGKN